MKNSQHLQASLVRSPFYLYLLFMTLLIAGCHKGQDCLPPPKVTTVVSGLVEPMGLETDWAGNIWVAETGTANNDGKVVVVGPKTKVKGKEVSVIYDAVINLSSIKNALSGETEGPAHLLFNNETLYILAGDFLYRANVASFKPGDAPIDANTLPREDIGSYVRAQNIVTPNDSHPYNLIKGPDGNLYIVDAGANAIIKRKSAGSYSVFAKFPDITNPTSVGPPFIQSVPTGIIFDGSGFLVSTLTGFPFLEDLSVIYRVSFSGKVSVCQSGFTTLTGITPGNIYGHAVLHYGSFGATGFVPNSGSLLFANGASSSVIVDGLNMPAGIKQIDSQSWYVTSLADGTLLKISYN